MQVARNFFLSKEKTLTRKFNEMLLAFKIEHSLSKDQILELYINQIYLGQRAYGFAAAAQIYFGKPLDQLTLAEMAMLAGLPKAPSRFNPIANPKRAKLRQQYVLRRMRELGLITDAAVCRMPTSSRWRSRRTSNEFTVRADYFAEMVRQFDVRALSGGRLYAAASGSIPRFPSGHQEAAYAALRKGVHANTTAATATAARRAMPNLGPKLSDEDFEDALQDDGRQRRHLPGAGARGSARAR